tara:strand:- start:94 stop:642 length:549 start_codon:yes stop_codon:yes gene_type:complete
MNFLHNCQGIRGVRFPVPRTNDNKNGEDEKKTKIINCMNDINEALRCLSLEESKIKSLVNFFLSFSPEFIADYKDRELSVTHQTFVNKFLTDLESFSESNKSLTQASMFFIYLKQDLKVLKNWYEQNPIPVQDTSYSLSNERNDKMDINEVRKTLKRSDTSYTSSDCKESFDIGSIKDSLKR